MEFNPIAVDDYHKLKRYFENQPHHLSTYSLFSIIVWSNHKLRAYFAVENDTLIIINRPEDDSDCGHLILPLPFNDAINAEYLYDLAERIGCNMYCFIPETFIQQYGRDHFEKYFTITEQPEFEDYIYLTDDLAGLRGNKFARQRNWIHQFQNTYMNHGRVDIEAIAPHHVKDCLEFLEKWCVERNCDLDQEENFACEKIAAMNALNSLDRLEAEGILIRIDGIVSGFGISSYLTNDMGILNFEKAYSHIKGLYQFLDNECTKRLFKRYTYINKESDMSIPNLAQSKNSYNPVMKLKSYCLHIR